MELAQFPTTNASSAHGMIQLLQNSNDNENHRHMSQSAPPNEPSIDLNDLHPGQELTDRDGQHHPVAEFLYQLTKMLTDDNSEVIEWIEGRIKVHNPERLEADVLHKYFRHSKFASFQRQLNYFGFRKIAGKGKMSPCSYVNEAATSDIRSLLLIKRKTNGSAARKAALQQRSGTAPNINPAALNFPLAGFTQQQLALLTGGGGQLTGEALTNAMALLSQNAMRAGMGVNAAQANNHGINAAQSSNNNNNNNNMHQQQQQQQQTSQLLALQQQHLQQQLRQQQQQQQKTASQDQNTQMAGFSQLFGQQQHQQQQQPPQQNSNDFKQQLQQQFQQYSFNQSSFASSQDNNNAETKTSENNTNSTLYGTPSLEQLHAQLSASLQQNALSGLSAAPTNNFKTRNDGPASAALQQFQNPATAAMDASSAQQNNYNNLFDSAVNLKSLLNEHQTNITERSNNAVNPSQAALANRLPSASNIFPEMSSASFGNLLGSSNRLSSLLSLNSFMGSREPSMADFAMLNQQLNPQYRVNNGNNQ